MLTPADLIAFEDEMAEEFNAGRIKAPLHLAGGNEQQLIDIFREVRQNDWCLCSWRSHYHCLLKGVSREQLKQAILEGRSIGLCFPDHKILSSGIVGDIASLAVGIALAIKKKWEATDHVNGDIDAVWCFVGDMTWETGIVQEAVKYAAGHSLEVHWVIEDNHIGGAGVPTQDVWGLGRKAWVANYEHTLTRPFVGTGKWIPL